jgi:Cdc6-like AAA superfamily ATPase
MGLFNFFSKRDGIVNQNIKQMNPKENFGIPLKYVEKDRIGLQNKVLTLEKNLSVMVLGQPGSGKTSTITFLAKQMQADKDDPVVIFDYKGDYAEKGIYDSSNAIVLSLNNSTYLWNIFNEADHMRDYRTIADALFQENENKNSNEFFTKGAQDLFAACLYHIDNSPNFPNPSNKSLIEFIYPRGQNTNTAERIRKSLLRSNESKVRAAASELDPNSKETMTNMYQTLRKRVGRVFDGDFAKRGDFSIRDYMEDPQGRSLVLDMSGPEQDVMAPIFRIFLDWSIKLALNDKSRYTYFILDEFDEVGELQQIQRLLSTGRAQLTEAVIGVQSRSQLRSVYGDNGAQTILGNCPQKILMRTADDKEYVREQIGKEKYEIEQMGYSTQAAGLTGSTILQMLALSRDSSQAQENEKYPIEEQEIGSFDRGEGIFLTEKGWVWGRFPLWEELSQDAQDHLTGANNSTQSNSSPSLSQGPVQLIIGSETVDVTFDEFVGKEIREAYERDGGNTGDAKYVHREHIRFSKSGSDVLLTAIGQNDTELNGQLLKQGNTIEIKDGDRLQLGGEVSMQIKID